MLDFYKNFRLYEGDDPAAGGGNPTPTPTPTPTPDPTPDPTPNPTPAPVGFTIEQVKQMEVHRAEMQASYDKQREQDKVSIKEDLLKDQEAKKDEESKAILLSKVSENESLKKKFEDYKLDPNLMSSKGLDTHINIFNDVLGNNTAAPAGGKISTEPITIDDTVSSMEKQMEKRINGGK